LHRDYKARPAPELPRQPGEPAPDPRQTEKGIFGYRALPTPADPHQQAEAALRALRAASNEGAREEALRRLEQAVRNLRPSQGSKK
jgi:hypothetical protein